MNPAVPPSLQGIKILVLDDEKEIVEVFSDLMKQFNYNADFFSEGESALEAMIQKPALYDLILTDIKMPDMDGISFIKRVRMFNKKIPVIFMTGYPSGEIKNEVLELGNVVFLEKPFHLQNTLEKLIPKLVGQSN